MNGAVKIGQAAKLTGMTVDAIRFYQRQGLLKQPRRTDGGFRLFESEHLDSLRFIRRSQALGFSLEEIRDLLFLESRETSACLRVKHLLQRKLTVVREKLGDLRRLEQELADSLRKCRRELRRQSREKHCPVLAEITRNPIKGAKQC